MIISIEELCKISDFVDIDESILERKLNAIESLVRSYTHNNFQNRRVRMIAPSNNKVLYDCQYSTGFNYLKVGDTVEIVASINNGLYIIKEINEDGTIVFDKDLYDCSSNLITKIEYPADVVEGCINLLKWEFENRDKVGVKAETISRHSVTYFDMDSNNSVNGYPVSLLGFLKPYMKARF